MHSIEQYAIDMVKKLRHEHRLTAKDIARIIGTSSSFIGNVENTKNICKYNMKHINAFAVYFKVSPRFFFPKEPFKE